MNETDVQRELNRKILDKIASDPQFREELLDDPAGALERAGLVPENRGDEVSGYGMGMGIYQTTAIICIPPPPPKGSSTAITCPYPPSSGSSTAITCGPAGNVSSTPLPRKPIASTAITCTEPPPAANS